MTDDDGIVRLDKARQRKRDKAAGQNKLGGEEAIALEFARLYDGLFVYDHDRGGWFRWTGEIWQRDPDEYALDCVRAWSGSRRRPHQDCHRRRARRPHRPPAWRAITPPGIPIRYCSACPVAWSTCAPATYMRPIQST